MNKSTYFFKVLFALVLSIVFIRCEDEPIETAPTVPQVDLIQKSAKLSGKSVEGKLRMSLVNMAGSNIEAATGYLDKIYLENLEGEREEIWDSLELFDFLDLEAGIGRDIAVVSIPPDTYKQAICDIVSAEVTCNGKVYNCVVPGEQMILEFIEPQEVGYHLSPEFTLEIDMSKSFFPVYSRSLYKNYFKYLMKLKRKPNWKKDYVSFDEFKKNQNPKYFIMNPYVRAINTTTNGTFFGVTYAINPDQSPIGTIIGVGLTLTNGVDIFEVTQSIHEDSVPEDDFFAEFAAYGITEGFFFFENLPAGNYSLDIMPYEYITVPPFTWLPSMPYLDGSLLGYPMDVEIISGNISTITNDPNDPPFAYVIALPVE